MRAAYIVVIIIDAAVTLSCRSVFFGFNLLPLMTLGLEVVEVALNSFFLPIVAFGGDNEDPGTLTLITNLSVGKEGP